jgi:hypothetical protein
MMMSKDRGRAVETWEDYMKVEGIERIGKEEDAGVVGKRAPGGEKGEHWWVRQSRRLVTPVGREMPGKNCRGGRGMDYIGQVMKDVKTKTHAELYLLTQSTVNGSAAIGHS